MREEPTSYKRPVGRPKGLKVKKTKLKESIKKRHTFVLTDQTAELLKGMSEKIGLSMSALIEIAVSKFAETQK
ncbi:MAG: hypothetical protein LBI82_00430 [Dysgonamonadaceae bacterium]|jgi:RNA processing factor Prp31|nr:hypothetical protein [Dysgonamonadaceae bacterium]